MKKLYWVICDKHKKFEKPKISCLLEKTLIISIICSKRKNDDQKIFKEEEESFEVSEFLGLIENK